MAGLSVLWIGDPRRPEFREAWESLHGEAAVCAVADCSAAERRLTGGDLAPDLIVAAQAYPGHWTTEQIDALRRRSPLSRIVALLGSWCEGEGRSGQPWPATQRIYWHQWPARWRRELHEIGAGRLPEWALPITASPEERLLAASQRPLGRRADAAVMAIRTASRDTAELLANLGRRLGYAPRTFDHRDEYLPVPGVAMALWDGPTCDVRSAREITRLAECVHPAPVVALLGFPRIDETARALAAGAASVVSKPFRVEDLLGEIERLADSGQPSEGSQV